MTSNRDTKHSRKSRSENSAGSKKGTVEPIQGLNPDNVDVSRKVISVVL